MPGRIKRILIATCAAIAIACLALYVAVERVLPYSIIEPHRITHSELINAVHGDPTPEMFGLRAEQFNITVDDSINLKGWFIHGDSLRPAGTVLMLHGLASCKEALFPMARTFARTGLNSILFDLRAHGESGGRYCSFGYHEKRDVSRYLDSAIVRFGPAVAPVAVMGGSLGAAVALQAMETDQRICCGVVESPFATLREIVFDYMKRRLNIAVRWASDLALDKSGEIAGFPVDSVRPEESARRIAQPVMVVHGLLDQHISPDYGRRVYENLSSHEKEWVPVPQASHFSIASVGGEAYKRQVVDFMKKQMRQCGHSSFPD